MAADTPPSSFPRGIQEKMDEAGLAFLHRTLVGVINTDAAGHGSAVAVEHRGETFLFTAAHNLPASMDSVRFFSECDTDDFVPIEAKDKNGDKVDRFYGQELPIHRVATDGKHDVAFIHTDKEVLRSKLKKEPVPSTLVGGEFEFGWQGIVHGFPSGYAEVSKRLVGSVVDYKNRKIQERYESIIQFENVAHIEVFLDPNGFSSDKFNRDFTEQEIFLTRTQSKPFSHFKGFSGGGIWVSEPFELPDDELFIPTTYLRLIGIQNSASLDTNKKHYIRGTAISVALKMADEYLDTA